jgi:hypothetical protein
MLRIRDPVLFYSWIRDECFPDPGSLIPDIFDYAFAPATKRIKKKVSLHSTFHVGSGIQDENMFGSGSGTRKFSDPRSGRIGNGCYLLHIWLKIG